MSIDQSSYPDWQWDGSMSEDEIRAELEWTPIANALHQPETEDVA